MSKTIKFGLKNVHYAIVTETTTSGTTTSSYGTVKPWPGAVSLSMQASQDKTVFRADDSDYYVSYGEGQYTGTLETALIPEELKKIDAELKRPPRRRRAMSRTSDAEELA